MQRSKRKLEHIKYALQLEDGPASTHLSDIQFLHNCLPELNPADINLNMKILGKQLRLPFFIDAITGSTDAVTDINRKLAQVAAKTGIGMAVGSQVGTLKNGNGMHSFTVVREEYPDGLVMGNVSALVKPAEAQAAVDLLQADALEVHLNAAQEIWMHEGDKDYRGLLANVTQIADTISVPVVVKETGCGIGREAYLELVDNGLRYFDCAGAGGTNFAAIEAARAEVDLNEDFAGWGVPTCWSLIDAAQVLRKEHILIASGGLRTSGDLARAFALGADAVSMARPVLELVQQGGVDAAVEFVEELAEELQAYLLLLGCSKVTELRRVPLFIKGDTAAYIASRGYNLPNIARSRERV